MKLRELFIVVVFLGSVRDGVVGFGVVGGCGGVWGCGVVGLVGVPTRRHFIIGGETFVRNWFVFYVIMRR